MLTNIIKEPYAWPGGYMKVMLLADGAILCPQCCKENSERIMSDIRDGYNTGWMPMALSYEAGIRPSNEQEIGENDSQCAHCGVLIGELGA